MEAGKRRRLLVLAALVVVLVAADLARAPADQLTSRALLGAIDLYQATVSPRLPALGVRCRFTPTCSRYGEAAIRQHGALAGSLQAAGRLLRCGPWTPQGTFDPP